jgi:hypothetical protein
MAEHEPEDFDIPDKEYNEEEDEDFNPEDGGEDAASSSSEDEDEPTVQNTTKAQPHKRKADVLDELDSGDEATIQERKKKRKKKGKDKEVAEAEEDDDSGAEGGFVRTRAQRLAEKSEKKERKHVDAGEVTINVEELWAELKNEPIGRPPPPPPRPEDAMDVDGEDKENAPADEMITIRRRIEYAGEVTEVEETVPRSSKAAQQYLKEHPEADPNYKPPQPAESELRRPLKRPSMFEPNPTASVKGVPPEKLRPRAPNRLDVLLAGKKAEEEMKKKAEKMTTVQKSALDWKGFVDQQGLREELDEYGKSKRGFLAREEFLGRADLAREMAARDARLKG